MEEKINIQNSKLKDLEEQNQEQSEKIINLEEILEKKDNEIKNLKNQIIVEHETFSQQIIELNYHIDELKISKLV